MLQGRLFSYLDTHRYRIGTNYLRLPVSRPKSPVRSRSEDGAMRYANPSIGSMRRTPSAARSPTLSLWRNDSYFGIGETMRPPAPHAQDDDFGQPRRRCGRGS